MNDVLSHPHDVCAFISGPDGPYPVTHARVEAADSKRVILHVTLQPITALRHIGYPDETVGIYVDQQHRVIAIPHNAAGRRWLHRNPIVGDLCLWYVHDPSGLQWQWEDGCDAYLGIVSRHLQAEERYRRGSPWPFEDAPHGRGAPNRPHPIRTGAMRVAAWRRR